MFPIPYWQTKPAVVFCHAATIRLLVGLAVRYDTTEVSMWTVFLSSPVVIGAVASDLP